MEDNTSFKWINVFTHNSIAFRCQCNSEFSALQPHKLVWRRGKSDNNFQSPIWSAALYKCPGSGVGRALLEWNMSAVWRFFEASERDITKATCNVCKAKISCGGTITKSFHTSNLIRRLDKKHKGEHGELVKLTAENEKKKVCKTPKWCPKWTQEQTTTGTHRICPDSHDGEKSTREVMEFIVQADLLSTDVENIGFRRLLAHFDGH